MVTMLKLSNLRIGARLGFGFATVLVALVAIWALASANVQHAEGLAQTSAELSEKTGALSRAENAVWTLRWDVAQFIAVTDAATRTQIVERSQPTRLQFERAMAVYSAKSSGPAAEEEALSKELGAAFGKYSDARLRWFELLKSGKDEEAVRLRADVLTPAGAATVSALGRLIALQQKTVQQSERRFVSDLRQSKIAVNALGVVAFLLAFGIAWGLSNAITKPLKQAVAAVAAVARGDLTQPIMAASRDEFGQLLSALATMQENLRALAREVAESANLVADSSSQIAQGNLDLSQRTEEQASTLEETASQMEELTTTVAQNADHARQAAQLATGASQVASRGGSVVSEVVNTMGAIAESSRRISDIIGVIDGIAFQTNILALNAAVEAARAGEQGRGFAVVAAEVRSLAQRSASAAKEIKGLIGDSVNKVNAGTHQVDEAGRTMGDIVASVKKVQELIAEIASASQEQSAGIEQVNTAVTQMDQVVQQNASLVEEATAATESMKEQAASLVRAVGRFRTADAAQDAPGIRHQAMARSRVSDPEIRRISPDTSVEEAGALRQHRLGLGSRLAEGGTFKLQSGGVPTA
jgi:methyl-accepting chemotaxis protein